MAGKQSTWRDFTSGRSFYQALLARFQFRPLLFSAYTFCFQGTIVIKMDAFGGSSRVLALCLGGKCAFF